jgi:hypothetical protein
MKINVNILPDEQKEKRKIDKTVGIIGRFGISLMLVLLVLAAVLFAARLILDIGSRSIQDTSGGYTGNADKEIKQTEKFFNEANASAQKINKISSGIPYWSKVMKKLSEISPPDLRLTLIHVEKEHIKLSGFSKNRDPSFLDFQEKLKAEGFKNINSPNSNLVSKKDFNFDIEMDVDSKYLNQN